MRDAWRDADLEARAQLVSQVYQRIIVEDGAIIGVELTEAAKRHGFHEALPETVIMARPARARRRVAIPILPHRGGLGHASP
jgi:hypothetical protein